MAKANIVNPIEFGNIPYPEIRFYKDKLDAEINGNSSNKQMSQDEVNQMLEMFRKAKG